MVDLTIANWRRARGRWSAALVAAGVALVGGISGSSPALAAPQDAGDAVVVTGEGSTRVRTDGRSDTEFSLRLPAGASCPGDSANDDYRVQSFMVPTNIAPTAVQYSGVGITPNVYGDWATFRQPLYLLSTSAFSSAVTAEAAAPGQPGAIVGIPTFSFGVYGPGELPAGTYHLGIACTLYNEPVKYWDTRMTVALAPGDTPGGISWTVAATTGDASDSNGLGRLAGIGGVVVAVVIAGIYARRRHRPRIVSNSTEDR